MKRFDAAIVGAGPAGSSAAIFLARKGYSVTLVDKSFFPRDKLCGDFLNPVNWDIFERLGIEGEILALQHAKIGTFRISTSGIETRVPFVARSGRRGFGLGLRRSLFDDLLMGRAAREGVAVKLGCKINGLRHEGSGWRLTSGDLSTKDEIRSTLLIGADGRNSWIAHRLGLVGPDESSGKFIGLQFLLEGCKEIHDEVQIHCFPGGYAGLVSLGGGVLNLCMTVDKEAARAAADITDLFARSLYRNPYLKEALDQSHFIGAVRSAYPVRFSDRRCHGDSFLLIGDAARVTEPVTGEGVYFALKSGELAAEAADLAFKRREFSARQLSSYDLACRRAFSRRQIINRFIRTPVYHPYLLTALLGLSVKTAIPVNAAVRLVCQASS